MADCKIYERGVAGILNSVDLWTNYVAFKMDTSHDPDIIREYTSVANLQNILTDISLVYSNVVRAMLVWISLPILSGTNISSSKIDRKHLAICLVFWIGSYIFPCTSMLGTSNGKDPNF